MGTVLAAFGLVFVAEMGDKSQLAGVGLSTRYRPTAVLAGMVGAAVILHGLAVTVGAAVATAVPAGAVRIGAGTLFLVFALVVFAQRPKSSEPTARRAGGSGTSAAFLTVLVAEMGDKTQLAVATFAATRQPVLTWVGAVAGMAAADGLAIAAGVRLQRRIPSRTVQTVAAVAFTLTGVAVLAGLW